MFLEERYSKIIELVNKNGRVAVKDLAKEFEVSEDCIRKDLRELENRKKLKRVYGGAIVNRCHSDIKPVDERKNVNSEIKKQIAENAIHIIEEKDIIFLDVSTINLEIAKKLKDSQIKITVVTNMLEIAMELKRCTNIMIITVGGTFNSEVGAVIGAAADRYIKNFTYDKCFIGVCGINKESGDVSTINLEDGNTKKTIIECSNKSYLVMESEKYNYDEFFKFAKLDEVTGIITENKIK